MRGLFDLHDDRGAVADDALGFEHVLVALHERQRDPVGADGQRTVEVGVILFSECADGEQRVGQADALAGGERAAGDDFGDDAAFGAFFTRMRILPSSKSSTWPGATASKICGWVRNTRSAEPASCPDRKRIRRRR